MSGRKRLLLLISILAVVAVGVTATTLSILYSASFEQQAARLIDTAKSQAQLLQAVARYDLHEHQDRHEKGMAHIHEESPEESAMNATLLQIRDAHANMGGFARTGEFTLARLEGDQIEFLLCDRHDDQEHLERVPLSSEWAEPMRLALTEETGGTIVGFDYHGENVLAAYEPVGIYDWGIVAKIDLAEIRSPFIRAQLIAAGAALVLILLGSYGYLRIGQKMATALVESENRYRSLFEQAASSVVVFDPKTREIAEFNSLAHESLGYSREEFAGLTIVDLDMQRSSDDVLQKAEQIIAQSHDTFEAQLPTKEGGLRDVLVSARAIEIGGEMYLSCVWNDITERKRTEDELRNSEQKYKTLLENLPQKIFHKDKDLVYVSGNANFARDLGIEPDEFRGKTDHDFFPRELADKYRADDRRLMEAGKTEELEEKYVQDGQEVWVRTVKTPVRDEKGRVAGILGIFWDITEQRRAQEDKQKLIVQLHQADKMASIGQLAAGVAHEINNPVGYIYSNLNTMNKYLWKITEMGSECESLSGEKGQQFQELLTDFGDAIAESLEGADRVKKIVSDLQGFSRADSAKMESTNIARCVESTLNIVWNRLKYHCQVEKDFGETPPVYCNPSQINQVLLNLLINAGQATEGKAGLIEIKTRAEGDQVIISIKDNGSGIPEENLGRLFEPFFTTKEVGSGTGLGLSLSYGIIEEHNGKMEVSSEVGVGTEFRVILPVGQPAAQEEPATTG